MRTILLDRDGVINENRADHVKSWQEFQFLPGVLDALRLLTLSDFRIFVITNQAIINRGLVAQGVIDEIHHTMVTIARQHGAIINAIHVCPHRSDERCRCRKPQPGMLLDMAHDWQFDPRDTYLVGDALSDIAAGRALGCRCVLVQTGRGASQATLPEIAVHRPEQIVPDLMGAVRWVLEQEELTLTRSTPFARTPKSPVYGEREYC